MATAERDLLERIDDLWPELSEDLVENHCILVTRVAVEVGRYFGFMWQPLALDIIVFNQAGLEQFEQQIPIEEWPETAWSIGIISNNTPGVPGKGWDGHIVVQGSDFIADLSTTQFNRPAKDIQLDSWAFPIAVDPPWMGQVQGLHIYLNPRPEVQAFRSAPDWRENYKPYAAELIREIQRR